MVHSKEISVGLGLPVFYRFENLYEAKARVRYNTDTRGVRRIFGGGVPRGGEGVPRGGGAKIRQRS